MSVMWPTIMSPNVVTICVRADEVRSIQHLLTSERRGSLISYRRWQDFLQSPPRQPARLIVLASPAGPDGLDQIIEVLRKRASRNCLLAVVGDTGGGQEEIAARTTGAWYLVRPVHPDVWSRLLDEAAPVAAGPVGKARQADAAQADRI